MSAQLTLPTIATKTGDQLTVGDCIIGAGGRVREIVSIEPNPNACGPTPVWFVQFADNLPENAAPAMTSPTREWEMA